MDMRGAEFDSYEGLLLPAGSGAHNAHPQTVPSYRYRISETDFLMGTGEPRGMWATWQSFSTEAQLFSMRAL